MQQMEPVKFGDAFKFWLKLGLISFGGPAGQISIMHQELVERRRWISEKRFLHALNYCMVLPGPEAQQLATYIGWLMHRTRGGIIAGVLFILPSLALLIGLGIVYVIYGHLPLVAGLLYGVKPAVVAVVVQALSRIAGRTLKNGVLWGIAGAAFIAVFVLKIPFPWVVIGAGVLGFVVARYWPHMVASGGTHFAPSDAPKAAMIGDDTPVPAHARFSRIRLAVTLAAGLVLWIVPVLILSGLFGLDHPFTLMALFFTKAALLTFGGAYAVLPYVYQGAVTQYGWVTPTQMIDGLALGETTPGPLIMVVTFIGFVGGFTQQPLGPDYALSAGVAAALIVTWFTFLPSFIFVLAGGPMIEHTRGNLKLEGPLTAIAAAVVGVMLSLALFFAYHVLWPKGMAGPFDGVAAALIVASLIALMRFKLSAIKVLGLSALIGLGLGALRLISG